MKESNKAALATRFLHSRAAAVIISVMALAAMFAFYGSDQRDYVLGDNGTAFPSANEWISSDLWSFVAALGCQVLTGVAMVLLCRVFNVLRSLTWLYVPMFVLMLLATPNLAVQFYTGLLLVPVVAGCVLLLLDSYRSPAASRHVFLIFLVLSLGAASQYSFGVYLIVCLLGCMQMRILNGRTLVAALLGMITPWWILFGFGILRPSDVHAPAFSSIFNTIDFNDTLLLLVSVGFTGLLIILSVVLNVFRTIAYNARARANNGVFMVLSLVSLLACCADYENIISYIPILDFCAAMQVTHYFANHRADRSCFAIVAVMLVYFSIFLCQTVISI